jgi:mannosyl-oligosaccharide alpha-1,2-mannosidase
MRGRATKVMRGCATKSCLFLGNPTTLSAVGLLLWLTLLVSPFFTHSQLVHLTRAYLDTLWIMGLHSEFEEAVNALEAIDFSTCSLGTLNVFETTIRYLGGFLSAYDISGGKYPILLRKAGEMGDMLYHAFDTPNRMPITRWDFKAAARGADQEAGENTLVAEIGSLTLEFTRLSQLTGDPRYFDAVQRIMDVFKDQQSKTNLPGMWSVVVNAKTNDFTGGTGFTIGGMADSLYEYLPKVMDTRLFNLDEADKF